jgi:flagellum-specific peptidoglycan hydrolase FlgJ
MNPQSKTWLDGIAAAAEQAGSIFPTMQACEAALESGYGSSILARLDLNLFGTKQHAHPVYGTASIPTKEYLDGQWEVVNANWVKYPDLASCFADRMATLNRLKNAYPHYAKALAAPDEVTYINEVSQTWSTDPARSAKVQDIYREYIATT